jgi:hypothetical protein
MTCRVESGFPLQSERGGPIFPVSSPTLAGFSGHSPLLTSLPASRRDHLNQYLLCCMGQLPTQSSQEEAGTQVQTNAHDVPIGTCGHCAPKGDRFMLPDVNHPVWVQFVTGRKPVRTTKATINMLIHGNKMSYEMNPSPSNVKHLVVKSYDFLNQFQAIFPNEVDEILK